MIYGRDWLEAMMTDSLLQVYFVYISSVSSPKRARGQSVPSQLKHVVYLWLYKPKCEPVDLIIQRRNLEDWCPRTDHLQQTVSPLFQFKYFIRSG